MDWQVRIAQDKAADDVGATGDRLQQHHRLDLSLSPPGRRVETGGLSAIRQPSSLGLRSARPLAGCGGCDETGSVAPGQMGGHKPKAISGEHAVWLSQRIKNDDFTLRGLVAELAGRGLKVDYRSVWEFVHAEKLSFKKKRGGWRTRSSRRGAAASPVDKVSRSRRT